MRAGIVTCLGDALLAALCAATTGDLPLIVLLVKGSVASDSARPLTTGDEVDADGSGDRGMVGVDATRVAEVKDTPIVTFPGAVSVTGLLKSWEKPMMRGE